MPEMCFYLRFQVMESESKLKESLAECDRQKDDLQMKFSVLEREKAEHFHSVRYCLFIHQVYNVYIVV